MNTYRLAHRFARQVEFSRGYAPLYARLFGLLADWLAAPGREADPLVTWLIQAADGQGSLEVSLLLMAGLHRRILAGEPDVAELAGYYLTAGGEKSPDDDHLPLLLRAAILDNQNFLTAFIQRTTVQTNETARGLAWVLPLSFAPWPAGQLVDLGASAGLNLVAGRRSYSLRDPAGQLTLLNGASPPAQFETRIAGNLSPLAQAGHIPSITGRAGCDLHPFRLDTAEDELTLMSFIWPDQPLRMARLQEGIAAFHEVQATEVPVRLSAVNLPDELPQFLRTIQGRDPVMLYNTYMTAYLADRGASLRQIIGAWAAGQDRPVLWAQWEPAGEETPPDTGWCAWTLDAWRGTEHRHWRIGWVHPHGTDAQFEPAFSVAVHFLQNNY